MQYKPHPVTTGFLMANIETENANNSWKNKSIKNTMKRETKFRGKDVENDNQWRCGYLIQYPNGNCVIIEFDKDGNELSYDVDPDTIGQYTGLKDNNGTKIYEGDILKIGDSRVAEVYWSNEEAQYIAGNDGVELSLNRAYNHDGLGGSAIEVIGNIYERKEGGNEIDMGNQHTYPCPARS